MEQDNQTIQGPEKAPAKTQEKPNKDGFFKKLWRFIRNIFILGLIIFLAGYSVKLRFQLRESNEAVDSLRAVIESNYVKLDSLILLQDQEAMLRDSLDDVVDRMLGDRATLAMITIDTTLDLSTAQKAIEESVDLQGWVDSLCAPFPEGVSAHVKLHFLKEQTTRLERLNYRLNNKFGN